MAQQGAASNLIISAEEGQTEGFRLWPKGEIIKLIERVSAHVVEGDELIKTAQLQCLAHYKAHGDWTLMDKLYRSLPDGYIQNGLRQWLYRQTPLRYDPMGNMFALKPGEKGFVDVNMVTAAPALEQAMTQVQQGRAKRNLAERTFSLSNVINLIDGLEGRAKRAEAEGKMIELDRDNIYLLIAAVKAKIKELNLKPATVKTLKEEANDASLAASRQPPEIVHRAGSA